MAYILVMFWWGPSAGQLKTLDFKSLESCENAKKAIEYVVQHQVSGSFESICVVK